MYYFIGFFVIALVFATGMAGVMYTELPESYQNMIKYIFYEIPANAFAKLYEILKNISNSFFKKGA
jgi:hypothetical protein